MTNPEDSELVEPGELLAAEYRKGGFESDAPCCDAYRTALNGGSQ